MPKGSENNHDLHAVAVLSDSDVVGHIPHTDIT